MSDSGKSTSGRFTWQVSKDRQSVIIHDGGRHCSTVPRPEFERDGERMLACFEKGEAFVPFTDFAGQKVMPEALRETKMQLLEHGADMTQEVPEWVRYLAASEAREGGMFGEAVERLNVEQWPAFAREVFGSLYEEQPKILEEAATGADWISELMKQAGARPEWDGLRERVAGDPWACGIAAGSVVASLVKAAKDLLEQLPKEDPQRLAEDAKSTEELLGKRHPLTKKAKVAAAAAATAAASVLEQMEHVVETGALPDVLGAAAVAAGKEVAEILSSSGNMADLSTGALKSLKASPETMRRTLADNPNLRKLVELAGRLRIRARSKQRTKTKYAPESIVDVTIGGELERLLPSELGLLMLPQTKLMTMSKIQERKALQYDLEGEEQLDRGPVIMAVDSSGSMQGIRNQWAMAVAIAVLEIAAMQRRAFVLMHFDGELKQTFTVEKPANLKLPELVEMVSYFSGGGTNFAPPLKRATEIIQAGKQKDGVFARADVMLITDGQASWGEWAQRLKSTGAALYGVAIDEMFSDAMAAELTGCSFVSPAKLADASADVDLLFGI